MLYVRLKGTYSNIDCNAEWRYYGNDDSKFSDPRPGFTNKRSFATK